jgi:hypothetical protein
LIRNVKDCESGSRYLSFSLIKIYFLNNFFPILSQTFIHFCSSPSSISMEIDQRVQQLLLFGNGGGGAADFRHKSSRDSKGDRVSGSETGREQQHALLLTLQRIQRELRVRLFLNLAVITSHEGKRGGML